MSAARPIAALLRLLLWLTSGRALLLALLLAALALGTLYLTGGRHDQFTEPGYDREQVLSSLRATAGREQLEARITTALEADNILDAELYLGLADYLGVVIDPGIRTRLSAEAGLDRQLLRGSRDCLWKGFILGGTENATELGCTLASDLLVVGDVRDLTRETMHYAEGEPVDSLVLGLSAVGIVASVTTVASAGAAAPVATGASVLKLAKKGRYLSGPLLRSATRLTEETLELERLQAKLKGVRGLGDGKKILLRHFQDRDLGQLKGLLGDLDGIRRATSMGDAVRLLKYADNVEEVGRIRRLTKDFGVHSRAVLELLGKKALKVTRRVARFVRVHAAALYSLVASLAWGLVSMLVTLVSKLIALPASGLLHSRLRAYLSRTAT